jgi:hypothetical protein
MRIKNLSLFILFLAASYITNAQSAVGPNRPYLLINGQPYDALSLMVINHDDIKELNVLPSQDAAKYDSNAGKNGVVIVTLKNSAALITMDELLNQYHLMPTAKDMVTLLHYGFFYDKLTLKDPAKFAASRNMIQSLGVEHGTGNKTPVFNITRVAVNAGNRPGSPFDLKLDSIMHVFYTEAENNKDKGPILIR